MTDKITSATPEQWAEIEKLRVKVIENQTSKINHEDVRSTVNRMWARMNFQPPELHICSSPMAAIKLAKKILPEADKKNLSNSYYLSVWWRSWEGWYRGAEILGVKFDQELLSLFSDWCRDVPFVLPFEKIAITSENPTSIKWDEEHRLHCENGPAIQYSDGFSIYAIHGVRLPEHVVMAPDTIKIEEIRSENNAEIRRIMRERYGEGKYLIDSGAKLIDSDIGGSQMDPAPRVLVRENDGQQWLVGTDGGTGRTYYMPVGVDVKTCREAHESICGFSEDQILFGS